MDGLCTRADVPAWESIADGTTLRSGYVTHAGRIWLCMVKHIKSALTAPYIGSPLWLDVPELERR